MIRAVIVDKCVGHQLHSCIIKTAWQGENWKRNVMLPLSVALKRFSSQYVAIKLKLTSCDGRVVKALDLKSNGIFPPRFEPYSQRIIFFFFFFFFFFVSSGLVCLAAGSVFRLFSWWKLQKPFLYCSLSWRRTPNVERQWKSLETQIKTANIEEYYKESHGGRDLP